ncbi:MAG TPA: MBL fold metallo-hydrolase [Aridibacter sp.]|nr:MBL fold metallo-hydrolase [Aridibacter sp.]
MKGLIRNSVIAFAALAFSACSSSGETRAQAGSTPEPVGEGKVKVTYIANEGVMIEGDGIKIVIDGLHRKYLDEYAYPPDDLREQLEQAKGEFADIDLLLFSHIHGDHFSAESARLHLLNNKNAVLASSPQIVDAMKKDFGELARIEGRLNAIPWEWKTEHSYNKEVKISFLGLSHGTGRHASIQNFGHVIEVAGLKFLHLGDADMTDENFDSFDLEEAGIDVAFIPYRYLLSERGRELVDRQFKPKRIIAVHIDVNEAEKLKKDLEAADPRIRVFTKILETATF